MHTYTARVGNIQLYTMQEHDTCIYVYAYLYIMHIPSWGTFVYVCLLRYKITVDAIKAYAPVLLPGAGPLPPALDHGTI
jgi:hypothetical protein